MNRKHQKSWGMAYCGIVTALCVALMLLGAVIPIAMFIAPALAGFLIATVCVECGRTMALTAYAAVSLLALLFVPDKEVALIFVFLLLTSSMVPSVHDALGKVKTAVQIYSGKGGTPYTFTWIATPGVLILLAAVIGGKIQGADFSLMGKVLKDTCRQMWKTVVTIMSIMAMAKIMSHSGMIAEIAGMMVALTGSFYPAAAPFVGAIGTFVTGSGTSANVLFGGLQVETAGSLGLDPSWLAGANTVGATIGKMISPQSIAIGTAATASVGSESKILRKVIKYCVLFIIIAGLVAYAGSRFA